VCPDHDRHCGSVARPAGRDFASLSKLAPLAESGYPLVVRPWASSSLFVVGLLLGCREQPAASETGRLAPVPSADPLPAASAAAPAPLRRPREALNVLLLTIDSLRADMPWAGYPRPIAPNLTALAADSVVWEQHRSTSSYTAQTAATWLSGRYASTLQRNGYFFTGFASDNEFFPELLQRRGVRSIGLHAHLYFARDKGLDQGFAIWETVPGLTFDPETDRHVTSDKTSTRLIELLSQPENTSRQFFVWAHYMDPHDQYLLHAEAPDFGKKNRDRYDSEIFYTDLWLGKFLDFARAQPWWQRTAVVITGDHGEAFGEHGMYKHAFELWDVLVRVPLIIHAPGAVPRRIDRPRTHIDLAPTILDLMGVEPPSSFQGKTLVPELYGAEPDDRQPLLLELSEDSQNLPRRALVQGDYKLIVQGPEPVKALLYDLKHDPDELEDLARREPAKLAELQALLTTSFAEIPSVEPYGGAKLRGGRIAGAGATERR
jgi:choline-sulfatase